MNARPPLSEPTSPLEQLTQQPSQFEFFQAVRLLTIAAHQEKQSGRNRCEVGRDGPPSAEIVRFRGHVSHTFPTSTIVEYRPAVESSADGAPGKSAEMSVAFLGLTGPSGVLPRHYTQMLIDRVRARDHAMRDFIDLFHHRIISHFYQAWAKYHFPVLYEAAVRTARRRGSDRFTTGVLSLVGLGFPELLDRLDLHDETFLYYSGLFAHFPRNAVSLERMIADVFRVPVSLVQFQGQWLRLEESDQTRLTTPRHGTGWNNTLGQTAVAGERIWGIESKFRIRLGPLSWEQFLRFSPLGRDLARLAQLVRAYVGPDMDFEVQAVLRRKEVRQCQLGHELTAHLGWTTWAQSQTPSSDVEDAVFTIAEDPRC